MTAAFYCSLLGATWYLFQAINKPVLGGPLPQHLTPLLQRNLRLWAGRAHAGCSSLFIDGCVFCRQQGLTPAEKFGATCRYHGQKPTGFLHCLLGRFQPSVAGAHLGVGLCSGDSHGHRRRSCSLGQQESRGECREPWAAFRSREQLSAIVQGGWWVWAFQFLREPFSIFASFWDWIHSEVLRAHRRLLSESTVDDVLLAILSLPVCVADLRAKVSPLVVATDASEWRLGVSRTSSLTAK